MEDKHNPRAARALLYNLGQAYGRLREREIAREQITEHIKLLRKIGSKNVKEGLAKLEKQIAEALAKERTILSKQKATEETHGDIRLKMDRLEHQLTKYIKEKEKRRIRLAELEKRIRGRGKNPRVEIAAALLKDIERIDWLFLEIVREQQAQPKELEKIGEKIQMLRRKVESFACVS